MEPSSSQPAPQRLLSLDTYRGLIMISLAFTGFGLAATAKLHLEQDPESQIWHDVYYQFEHTEWTGCSYWDLIQPSFMFMVGSAMAFSYHKRKQSGQSYGRMLAHAIWRSFVLIFLGIFLISNWSKSTEWSLMNVLTQIGLGYTFLFLLWGRRTWVQALAAVLILGVTWGLYVGFPDGTIDISQGAPDRGVSAEWAQENLEGIPSAWQKNANVGHTIDRVVLNWFPREEPFVFNRGGYQTINFLPSLATMLFGLMAGELLRSRRGDMTKLLVLFLAGFGGIVLGVLAERTGVCPIVKRIWTPAWALYSGGWCCLLLGSLYAVIDVLRFRTWTYPLVVVGANSIAIYCMTQLLKKWVAGTFQTHLGQDVFTIFGDNWTPTVEYTTIGLTFWLICWWMYRNRIFIRI